MPDATLLLRLSADEASRRRSGDPDRIEAEHAGFHADVAGGFDAAAERFPDRIRVVDAAGPPRAVLARVRQAAGV